MTERTFITRKLFYTYEHVLCNSCLRSPYCSDLQRPRLGHSTVEAQPFLTRHQRINNKSWCQKISSLKQQDMDIRCLGLNNKYSVQMSLRGEGGRLQGPGAILWALHGNPTEHLSEKFRITPTHPPGGISLFKPGNTGYWVHLLVCLEKITTEKSGSLAFSG